MIEMLYHIQGYAPTPGMGSSGFNVQLFPAWKECVAESKITDEHIRNVIKNLGNSWLDGHGWNRLYDPDKREEYEGSAKLLANPSPPGPNTRRMYEARTSLRISWGEWGPEHISVPGNACGLDLDSCGMWAPKDGKVLTPHNVDSLAQASLLLTIFLFFADSFVLNQRVKK